MAKKHPCEPNDHISRISAKYNYMDWETVWNAPENKSLKSKRKNPHLLFKADKTWAGRKPDTVHLPEKKGTDSQATDKEYAYKLVAPPNLDLKLRILNVDFTPIKNAEYELKIDGKKDPYKDKTSDKGEIVAKNIPAGAQKGTLSLRMSATDAKKKGPEAKKDQPEGDETSKAVEGDVPVTWELKIGGLNPIMEKAPDKWCISGVQARLNNMAINSGPVDGILGSNTKHAVETFQAYFDLKKDGKPGQGETQPKLVDVHDKNTYTGSPVPKPATGINPVPKNKKLETTAGDIGHVAPCDGKNEFFNTLVVRPEYRISIKLGDIENLFSQKPDTDLGRMARFQVLGLYPFPLGHKVSTTPGLYAKGWHHTLKHVKTKVFGLADDAANADVDEKVAQWLKSRVINGEDLPPKADDPKKPGDDNFCKIRIPGGYTYAFPSHVSATDNDDSANGYDFSFGKTMYPIEDLYYRDNPVLGKIPLVALVEKKIGDKWEPAKDVSVYFRLMTPYDLPHFDYATPVTDQINRPPLHPSSIGDNMTLKNRKKGAGPKKESDRVEKENAQKGDVKNDPQADNCHKDYGGKRGHGSLTDGTDVKDVIFQTGDIPGFTQDHSEERKLPHPAYPAAEAVTDPALPHAVKAKTNEEGNAGVVFMPSRCGGDRYRICAYVGPSTLMDDGMGTEGVRVETGTFVVWRNIRISRYIRQNVTGVANTLLTDAAPYGFGNQNDYLKRVGVVNSSGTNVGFSPFNTQNAADQKAATLGNAFDRVPAQFARAFCEIEMDADAETTLGNDEWKAARATAIKDGKKAVTDNAVNVDLDVLCMTSDNTLNANNTVVHLPMLTPVGYRNAVPLAKKPALAPDGINVDPAWITSVANAITFPVFLGFHRHLSKNGFLPGLTIVQGGYGHTWQILGIKGMGGVALSFRACYDWYGAGIYLEKVQRPTSPPTPNLTYSYDFTSTAIHEMGHLLFRVHAPGFNKKHRKQGGTWQYYNSSPGAGAKPERHDPLANHICVMSYKICEGLFCSKCLFGMRGWDLSKL